MAVKDKDLFLDMLENPNLTLEDMVSVGHSAESTRFLDKSMYENSQRVRNKFMDSDGNFKQDEFDKWYAVAADSYQKLTDKDANLSLMNVTAYNESDITVSPEKRTLNTKPIVSFSPNPDRLSTSIFRIGKTSERERTLSELALAEKVLLNPVEAALDPSKARWGDSPNDSWWGNFFDTLVLAQWDEDGEHVDPVTKLKVSHKAGELKLNDNGTYYYEALDGRDIYGRLVLNKFNTITTDGSFWNQYDFFDSDDIKEKSFVGSVAKNLALVGSMFIPYVGWGIAGASIAALMIGLTGTLGKMLTGSDSPTFSAMEGWSKSLSRQGAKSEYAQQNMLCWENFIDLIGDTTAQLREQRAIFKFAPAMFGKGKYGIDSKHFGMNAKTLKEAEMATVRKATNADINWGKMAQAVGGENPGAAIARANTTRESVISNIADLEVKKYFENYNKLGEQIARAYMIGITVGDTYGEAKEAGATDFEATMLTLGYAAAENKLLNSELGRWIFPELKAERATMSQIAKKVTQLPEKLEKDVVENTLKNAGIKTSRAELIAKRIAETPGDVRLASEALNKLDDKSRLAWMKTWFNKGKEVFDTLKSVMKGAFGAAMANALAEGTEEVSEELLKDFSTSCFNLVKAAQGDKDTRMQGFLGEWDWNQALKRYGMSFFGGMVGGGINSAAYDYKQFKDIANMSSESAMQLLVWMDRNNEMDKFWDIVSKENLGNKYLSTLLNEDGTYKPGTEEDNLDLEVKRALRNQIDLVHNILNSNGANIDDDGLIGLIMNSLPAALRKDILGDFRTNALATSVTAGRFLKEYNKLCGAIALETIRLKNLNKQTTDSQKPSEDLKNAISESEGILKTLLETKDNLLNGERSAEFYRDALFETTYGVSESFIAPTEVQFMERETGKSYSLITEKEKEALKEKYVNWSKSERSEEIHYLSDIFWNVAKNTSQSLQESADTYLKIKEGLLLSFLKIAQISAAKLTSIMDILDNEEITDPLTEIQSIISDAIMNAPSNSATPMGLVESENGLIQGEGAAVLSGVLDLLGNELSIYTNRLNELFADLALTSELKTPLVVEAFLENVHKELDKTAKEILEVGFVHPEVKRNLVPVLRQTAEYCEQLLPSIEEDGELVSDGALADKYGNAVESLENIIATLNELADQIEELRYTPITENLKNFGIGIGAEANVLKLVEAAIDKESSYQETINEILIDDLEGQLFEEAEKLLKLYRTSIIAARNDNADVNHIFGYNKILNELCGRTDGWEQLAEIDADTAQLALLDVNLAIDRLNSIKGISELNRGNKLNEQNHTAANKNRILYNKTKKLLTSLLNEDDDEAIALKENWNRDGALDDLKVAIDNMAGHRELWENVEGTPILSLNSEQKEQIERELHLMDDAIYNFFLKNLDKLEDTETARKELAKFLKVAGIDLYSENEGLLTKSSKDIDDGAFIWWLASKAALKSSDFYKEYRKIISEDIAPIPTLELGIYSAVAAIYNGDVFKAFGKAMKQYVYDDWYSKEDTKKDEHGKWIVGDSNTKLGFIMEKGLYKGDNPDNRYYLLPFTNDNISEVNYSDLVPSFNNILFIEGVPGSGKSTGVFRTIAKMLNELDPDIDESTKFLSKPIMVAHSTLENAEKLAKELSFKDGTLVAAKGKEELLSWMSKQYKNKLNLDSGYYEYKMGEDCIVDKDGNIHSNWELDKSHSDVPSIIFIDEWSRYTLPEADLINRFASEYGIQIISAGDLDLLSPTAYIFPENTSNITDEGVLDVSISRNMTPRVPKLGVSMRSGNGQKTHNLHLLLAYKRNPITDPVNLLYVETDLDLYGDKVYRTSATNSNKLTELQLRDIEKDIDKLVSNLDTEHGEKIGYIYHDTDSDLYKLLQSEKYKDKIDAKVETAALGLEARYYIVENKRDNISLDDYLKSLYTGISRAEQATIVVAPNNPVGKLIIKNPEKLDNKLIPDNFTSDGVSRFSKQRLGLLNNIYGEDTEPSLQKVKLRTKEAVPLIAGTPHTGRVLNGLDSGSIVPYRAKSLSLKPNTDQLPESTFKEGQILKNGIGTLKILKVSTGGLMLGLSEFWYQVDDGSKAFYISESKLGEANYLIVAEEELPKLNTKEPETKEPASENPIPETVWELTSENLLKVIAGIERNKLEKNTEEVIFGKVYVERAVGANPGDLDTIFAELLSRGLITPEGTGYYAITKEDLANLLNTAEPLEKLPSIPLYKLKDRFKIGAMGINCEIDSVTFDDLAGEFIYILKDPLKILMPQIKSESELQRIEEQGGFKAYEENHTPLGEYLLAVTASTFLGTRHLERVIERDAQDAEEDKRNKHKIPELSKTAENDIQFSLLGHSWNTNYLGIAFDEETGRPKLPLLGEPGARRIDCANGLVRNGSSLIFVDEKSCRDAIGTIRKSMMFDSNERIAEVVKLMLPEDKRDLELTVTWAFISKSKVHKKGDGGRFFYDPQYKLDNMEDMEKSEIPIKTISIIINDEAGNAILEMPLLTLNSPFTVLYQLGLTDKNNPIYLAYKLKAESMTDPDKAMFEILNAVISAINTSAETKNRDGEISAGYKKLLDLCKLWLFTNDGIVSITNMNHTASNKNGEKFNLHAHATNLGSHYIKERIADEALLQGKDYTYGYSRMWRDLTEQERRSDVNYSDIMMVPDEYDSNYNRIAAAGHPFILRSDSDLFQNGDNKGMLDRYLYQQKHLEAEKIVKLEILTPPEMSVLEWLFEREKGQNCHYGNEFSAYRVLSALRTLANKGNADAIHIWRNLLDLEQRQALNPILDLLDQTQAELEQANDENHLEYLSRVFKEQSNIMHNNNVAHELSNTLFKIVQDYTSHGTVIESKHDIANKLLDICKNEGITGILYRAVCQKGEGAKISNYAILVQTGNNRFTNPDEKSYRIYGRYETPIFNLDNLRGFISKLAEMATMQEGSNIWRFVGQNAKEKGWLKKCFDDYNAEGKTKLPLEKTPNLELKENYADLLETLELEDYNRLDSITDQTKFLEAIRDKYIETPGNIAVVVNGETLIYSKLDNTGVISDDKFDGDLATATLVKFVSNGAGDNSYTLTLKVGEDTKEINVEVIGDELAFDLGLKEVLILPLIPMATFNYSPMIETVSSMISKYSANKYEKIRDVWKKVGEILNRGASGEITRILAALEIKGLLEGQPAMLKSIIEKSLGKEIFEENTIEQQLLEPVIACPIIIRKKFIKK